MQFLHNTALVYNAAVSKVSIINVSPSAHPRFEHDPTIGNTITCDIIYELFWSNPIEWECYLPTSAFISKYNW